MNWRRCQLVVCFVILTVAFAGPLGAEDPNGYERWDPDADSQYPESALKWGTSDAIPIAIPSTAFDANDGISAANVRGIGSYRYCLNEGWLYAPFYPTNGSSIDYLMFRGIDYNPSGYVSCDLLECSDDQESCDVIKSLGTDDPFVGGPFSVTAVVNPSLTVDTSQNTYVIRCHLTGGTDTTRLGNFRIKYHLQVSPSPATATFGDVPTGHLFFQHIEALAASEITAGCGGGNYCPDDAVTRGQMAVFLAKALGLHWPG